MIKLLIFVLLCGVALSEVRLQNTAVMKNQKVMLLIDILIDNMQLLFSGSVIISLSLSANSTQSTSKVELNFKDLTIGLVTIKSEEPSSLIFVQDIVKRDLDEILEIHFSEELKEGTNYELELEFTGRIRDDLTGLYKSSYWAGPSDKR